MKPEISILISSHERSRLLRRTLYSIASRPPSVPFELVIADDGSQEDIPKLLSTFGPRLHWTFIRVDVSAFEKATGIKRYFNNPSLTNNIAFKHAQGDLIYLMGNEVIALDRTFDDMRLASPLEGSRPWQTFSTTYDLPEEELQVLDDFGAHISPRVLNSCKRFPLHSEAYRSDVTNYLSLAPRSLWEHLGGYDERYLAGIACEDSDFVRRARAIPGYKHSICQAVSLHQSHGGKTVYYEPKPEVIDKGTWNAGVEVNRAVYATWDGSPQNPQPWPWGTFGVAGVLSNWKK